MNGVDLGDIAAKTSAALIQELLKQTADSAKKVGKFFRDKSRQHDLLGGAARRYAASLERRFSQVRIFGMSRPVPLRSIYVRANILKKITREHRVTIEELETLYDRDRRRFDLMHEKEDAEVIADKVDALIVLGKPGSGKTTFLKKLLLACLDGSLHRQHIPVFISLKDWFDSGRSLLSYVVGEFKLCGLPSPNLFVHHLLSQGRCLLLMDGFDEVTGDVMEAVKRIKEFVTQFRSNHFVMSCRLAAYNYVFEEFTDAEIADFDSDQIEAFVDKWFVEEADTAARCKQQMSMHAPIRELASVPLLLTLLCLAFEETLDFPTNKAELYKEAIDALLKKWDTSRGIRRSEIYKNLTVPRKEQLLGLIAYSTFRKSQYFFKQIDAQKVIEKYIENLPDSNITSLDLDSEAVLKAIEAHHGLLIERAHGVYSFSHLTLQEYFVASHIIRNEARGLIDELLKSNLLDGRLREVILITASLLPEADGLLLAVRQCVATLGKSPRVAQTLASLMDVISAGDHFSRVTGIEPPREDSPIMRVAALYEVLRRLSIHSNQESLTRRLMDDLQELISHLQHPKLTMSTLRNSKSALNRALDAAAVSKVALDLNKALIEERETLVREMWAYLAGTTLFVDCMRTQCYVSRSVRENLLGSVLLEPWSRAQEYI